MDRSDSCELLLDVSRLVWRRWSGRLPTGIDRVCLAYVRQFADRARAVVQWRGVQRVVGRAASARLFAILLDDHRDVRARLAVLVPRLMAAPAPAAPPGSLYCNVGHTGLDDPALPRRVRARGWRAVFLIHDLIPVTHPHFCRAGEAARHRARLHHVLACAAGVITNSAATAADLAAFAQGSGLALPPVLPAWLGLGPFPAPVAPPPGDRPWFITVGTIEGRKNHALLLQIWRKLALRPGAACPRLIIAGQRGWEAELATAMLDRDPLLQGHVTELSRVGDAELAGLIAGARALLMPSFAEGFGLPVIEALHLGTPVVASDLPVYRELAGAIPRLLDPTDGPGWLAAVQALNREGGACVAGWRAPGWDDHFALVEPWLAGLGR